MTYTFLGLDSGAWTALAGWATFCVAVVAATVALGQLREAQKTRKEQTQPNVVVFAENDPVHWTFQDLVVKNFGLTPAHDIHLSFDPELVVAPHSDISTGERVTHLSYPNAIPFLAPGQEWRTAWDSGVARAEHHRRHPDEPLETTFKATVKYCDSRDKPFTTSAVLDWAVLAPTLKVTTKTVHDIAETLGKEMEKIRTSIGEVATTLSGYTKNEHAGVWVYPVDASQEREHRAEKRREAKEQHDRVMRQLLPHDFPEADHAEQGATEDSPRAELTEDSEQPQDG